MSIGVMNPSMWANILFSIFLLFFDVVFAWGFKFDYTCLGYAWVISVYLQSIVQFYLSLSYPEVQRTLQPFNFTKACGDWKQFVYLGVPGTVRKDTLLQYNNNNYFYFIYFILYLLLPLFFLFLFRLLLIFCGSSVTALVLQLLSLTPVLTIINYICCYHYYLYLTLLSTYFTT